MSKDQKTGTPTTDTTDMKSVVTEAIKEGLTMGIMAVGQMNKPPAQTAKVDTRARCHECKQLRAACNGEHEKMVVYPRNARRGRWFQGIFINGVRYLSDGPGHSITVPKGNNIGYQVAQWERNEEELTTGRVAEHNSGSIGPGGGNVNAATRGWR